MRRNKWVRLTSPGLNVTLVSAVSVVIDEPLVSYDVLWVWRLDEDEGLYEDMMAGWWRKQVLLTYHGTRTQKGASLHPSYVLAMR